MLQRWQEGCYTQVVIKTILKNGSKIFSRRQSGIFSAAAILAATFGFSAILGVLRDRLLYARFYACCSAQLDAYNGAFRIPDIIFRLLVVGALSAAFIPVFSEQLLRNQEEAYKIASAAINILFLIALPLVILAAIFSYPLSSLIASGFNPDQIYLMSRLTRIMLFSQLFFLQSSFLTGILQSHQRFLLPALAPIVYNLGIIAGIQFLSSRFGIFGPAIGVVVGAACHFIIQLPLVIHLGFKYFPLVSFRLRGVKKILRLMFPRALALGLGEIESTVVLFLASALPTGSLSLFYLGQHLTQFFSRIFGTTIGQASLPVLSKEAGNGNLKPFGEILFNSLSQALYLAIPTTLILLVLRIPIVRLAYGAEKFPWRATVITGKAVAFFTPTVITSTIVSILVRGFYALQDTKTPLIISFISLMISIFAALLTIFRFNLGIHGLILAIVLGSISQALMLIFLLLRKIKARGDLKLSILKMFASGLFAGLTTWLLMKGLDFYVFDSTRMVGLLGLTGISLIGGLSVYLIFTLIFNLKEARAIFGLIKLLVVWPKSSSPLVELPPLD